MPEDMPDRMPDQMPEDMSDRMPEDLPVAKRINVMVGITRNKVFFETHYWAMMIPELQQIQYLISPEMFLSVPIS